jgi:hypothetical protein
LAEAVKVPAVRVPSGYAFANDQAAEEASRLHKIGMPVMIDVTGVRNPKFHRKYFVLLNLGFDYWEPSLEHKGRKVEKCFERYREDVAILSGYYTVVWSLTGEPRLKAKSISFAKMEQDEFDKLYGASIQVLLDKVMEHKGWTREKVDEAVNNILRFDG